HAYMYSELERLQEELDVARRRLQAISHVMYRHDDVVLTLQLLAYLSKTPSQRQQLHECPLLYTQMRAIYGTGGGGACAGPTLQLNAANSSGASSGYATQGDLDSPHRAAQSAAQANAAAGIPVPRRRQSAGDATVDVFSIVEKFTVHKAFPSDMAYWSAIVMRNGCRRDETRNYCRQCAYSKCQKWELHPNEFAKCRRCRKAKYCSKVCQSSAWQEGHRNWCNERNPSSAGNPGSMDGDAAVVAAAAATVTGSVVALAGTMPAQQPQPQQHAGAIGKDIQDTTLLLERLATLARTKTIFDDKTSDINALTTQVKQRIAAINGKIMSLQALQRKQGGGGGTNAGVGGTGQQASEHHTNIVMSLQSQLASTSTVFKDVLEMRSERLKASGSRKEQFIGNTAAAAGSMPLYSTDSPLYQVERKTAPSGLSAPYAGATSNEDFVALSLPDMDEASSSQMLLMQQNQSSSYLDSRSDAINSIESTISELGSIFQQLAQMVSEQRDVVQRIDANIETVDINISAAQNELLRYYSNISSNRWLMAKIFAIILVFVFLLVTFV
ncbi:Integral membrane protein SED5, partial [Coemansia sp. RSA 1836]